MLYCYVNVVDDNPRKWDPMPQGTACHVVPLSPNTTEYNEVKSKFEKTMILQYPSYHGMSSHSQYYGHDYKKIVTIERIQNPSLHAQYTVNKKAMDGKNPSNTRNERELFHGCPGDVAKKISHQGFNRSFAGKNGMQL